MDDMPAVKAAMEKLDADPKSYPMTVAIAESIATGIMAARAVGLFEPTDHIGVMEDRVKFVMNAAAAKFMELAAAKGLD